jgi:hypothetical protein
MSERLVAAFRGSVACRRESGAVQWCLCGVDRDTGTALEVLLSGAAALDLPAQFVDAALYVRSEAAAAAWELRSSGRSLPLAVRAVQVHRRADAPFEAALPRNLAPWSVRAGWFVLLNLVRVPGMARLLQRIRGHGDGQQR